MKYARTIVVGMVMGFLLVGSVWAGVSLTPVKDATSKAKQAAPAPAKLLPVQKLEAAGASFTDPLPAGQLLAGASKISLFPTPDATKGQVWERDKAKCLPLTSGNVQGTLTHAADPRITWIENNNCIYMGGFGIGPSQPVIEWDTEYGLWSRSAAFVRDGKAIVVTILDAEGYFGKYRNMCGATPCGAHDLAAALGTQTGLDPASFVFASTHAHSAMDYIGGWGGVPQWYMDQTAAAMKSSVLQALGVEACPANQNPAAPTCIPLQAATLEAGDALARENNGERRDSYRSAEDPTLNWIRARAADGSGTISTVGTFAGHATSFGGSAIKAHPDWPGVFDKRVEERFGGIGLMFEAGLGNMSASNNGGGQMGLRLGNLVPEIGAGTPIADPVVSAKQTFWDQPVTNGPLGVLGGAGFFDRPFSGPANVTVAKPGWNVPCTSTSPVSARVSTTTARVGGVLITAAPGEVFANYTNTIEEVKTIKGTPLVTALAIGQANDALGYMPQSFESDEKARQGGGFAGLGVFEYEDAYGIDRCFGDKALESTLAMIGQL